MTGIWMSLLAITFWYAASPVVARPVDRVNQSRCEPAAPVPASDPSSVTCQTETADETSATALKRKQYIQRVLAKSKVAGLRLDHTASGFFIAADGTLLTTASVVRDCAAVSVSPMYGEIALAKVVATEQAAGIALLHADIAAPGVAMVISSEGAFKRNPVYILGYPTLGSVTAEPVLTPVRVLNSQQTAQSVSTMLIDGDVRSGYNGGPIVDSGGGVIGIMTPAKSQLYGATDAPVVGMGLAAPSERLVEFLDQSGVDYRTGQQLPPKPAERILIDSRPFAAQIGCWQ
jgi:S1-C subfamily serine protease